MKKEIIKKSLLTMVLLTQGWPYGVGNQVLLLDEAIRMMGLRPQGYVVSGWMRIDKESSVHILERLLKCRIVEGDNVLDFQGEVLKVVLSGERGKMLSMQLVTTDVCLAAECHKFWQAFADTWGKGELIGITVMARAYEEMSPIAQEEYCCELATYLKADGQWHTDEHGLDGVYDSPYFKRAISVCQTKINYNVVLRQKDGYTDIYLAYPIIYQTY